MTRKDWIELSNHTRLADRHRCELVYAFGVFDARMKRNVDEIPIGLAVVARQRIRTLFPDGIVW